MLENEEELFKEANIDAKTLERLLRLGSDGPLKPEDVEDVILPEPWSPPLIKTRTKPMGLKRGPKSMKEWETEIRRIWGHLDDEDELAKSWLAQLPAVQKLAASNYGGRTIGCGLALQELLKKALGEVRQYDVERGT
jgi:hypothetical protein